MPRLRRGAVRQWLIWVFENHGRKMGEITYRFTDDEGILEVNRQFLDHDFYTDIITFDQSEPDSDEINGDLLISVERVKANATEFGVSYGEELHRVMVHGILHLVGFKDETEEEQKAMRRAENLALMRFKTLIGEDPVINR